MTIRRSDDRGGFDFGWLKARHTFSFGEYRDPSWVRFRSLRVLNDDVVSPRRGFDMHPHRDMEIVSYVLSGAVAHKDSLGNEAVSGRNEVQRMSAGSGVLHSEFASGGEPLRMLQIWIMPREKGAAPRYDRLVFEDAEVAGRLRAIASEDGREGSLVIDQDAAVYAARLRGGDRVEHAISAGRGVWVQVATGSVRVNGEALEEGDGASIEGEDGVVIEGEGEVLVFDMG